MLSDMTDEALFGPLEWRSLLFVPADNSRFIKSACGRQADAIILDLEDSVVDANKAQARKALSRGIDLLNKQEKNVVVRINQDLLECAADLDVAVVKGVQALMVSKVEGPEHISLIDAAVSRLELNRGLVQGSVRLIAMIESVQALNGAAAIASCCKRVAALALGTEDLSLDGGFEPTEQNLFHPAQQLVLAANSHHCRAYGFPGSIADFSDLEHFQRLQLKAKSMGFAGALCVHPSQLGPVNEVYGATTDAIEEARRIVAVYERAGADRCGAVALDGKMIDLPVVERARALLGLSE